MVFPVDGPEKLQMQTNPVEGLKVNFVEEVLIGKFPVVAVTHDDKLFHW